MFFKKTITIFAVLMLLLSVLAVMPGAAAPQRGNATYSSYSQTTSTTYIKVVQNGLVLKDEKKTETTIKQTGTITTKPLFPATPGNMYMLRADGTPHAVITTALDNGASVSGRICIAGYESDWSGDLMTFGRSMKVELIDKGSIVSKWEDSDPLVSNARFIDYSVAHSGKLSPNAYLKLYVKGAEEYQKLIKDKKAPSIQPGGGITRMDGTGIDNPSVMLSKKTTPGYSAMVAISFSSSGEEIISDPDIHMVAYFDSKYAVYTGLLPFTRVIDTDVEPVYTHVSLVTTQ